MRFQSTGVALGGLACIVTGINLLEGLHMIAMMLGIQAYLLYKSY
jgi:hypothetical protein